MLAKRIIAIISLYIIFFVLMSPVVSADTNSDINLLKEDIDHLIQENKELRGKVDSLSENAIISDFKDMEGNLIATADHAINRVNFWIAVFSIGVTVTILIGSISTYVLQKSRFDKLEKDIDKYKSDIELAQKELKNAKTELVTAKQEFELVKSESQTAAQCASTTQDLVNNQLELFQKNYGSMKRELEDIRDNVKELAKNANESKDKAKESEIKSKASEYFNKAFNSDNINEKISSYTKAIECDSKHDTAYNNRGTCYSELKEHWRALDDYNKAIGLVSNHSRYYRNRAGTLFDLALESKKSSDLQKYTEYYNKSLKDYEKALEVAPNDDYVEISEIYNNRANSYRIHGDTDLALEDVNKAIKNNDKNGYAYSTLSEIYAEKCDDINFYKYAELALKNNCPIWEFAESDPVYGRYKESPKFLKLIESYRNSNKFNTKNT